MTRCLAEFYRDERAALQIAFEIGENLSNQYSNVGRAQRLQPYANHGRSDRSGYRQDGVKIRVQGHDHGLPSQSEASISSSVDLLIPTSDT